MMTTVLATSDNDDDNQALRRNAMSVKARNQTDSTEHETLGASLSGTVLGSSWQGFVEISTDFRVLPCKHCSRLQTALFRQTENVCVCVCVLSLIHI